MIRIANSHEPCPHNTAARRTFDQRREITEIKINNTQHYGWKQKNENLILGKLQKFKLPSSSKFWLSTAFAILAILVQCQGTSLSVTNPQFHDFSFSNVWSSQLCHYKVTKSLSMSLSSYWSCHVSSYGMIISLINCQKGHKCLQQFWSALKTLKSEVTDSLGDIVTYWAVLRLCLYTYS